MKRQAARQINSISAGVILGNSPALIKLWRNQGHSGGRASVRRNGRQFSSRQLAAKPQSFGGGNTLFIPNLPKTK